MGAILIINDDAEALRQTLIQLQQTGQYTIVEAAAAPSAPTLPSAAALEDFLLSEWKLSPRECEIVLLKLRTGSTNREIAEHQHMSYESVKVYLKRMYRKCNVHGWRDFQRALMTRYGSAHTRDQSMLGAVVQIGCM